MVFIWYLLRFCLMTVALVVLVLGLYITLANAGLIRIPTYERSRIEASEEELREGRKDVAGLLPDTCLYGIYDPKGEYLEGNFPERLQEEAWEITADDGYTGTNFNRPGFQKLLEDMEMGYVSAIIVKDMSRLGRDYLQVGYYTDTFFPDHNIRFIAINDCVDSDDGENELAPFRNVMNEMYARDISRKVRSSHRLRGNAGEPLSQPPYGYMKSPENKKQWIIDPEAGHSLLIPCFDCFLQLADLPEEITAFIDREILDDVKRPCRKNVHAYSLEFSKKNR